MPIRLVKDDERLTFEFAGGNFYYRRPPLKLRKKWVNECTNTRGNVDFYGLIEKSVPYCLIGWDDKAVIDAENKPVNFTTETSMCLSEDFYVAFSAKLNLAEPDSEGSNGQLKNLSSTSSIK